MNSLRGSNSNYAKKSGNAKALFQPPPLTSTLKAWMTSISIIKLYSGNDDYPSKTCMLSGLYPDSRNIFVAF